ncbi:probable tyrosyl-DNA phosphodiesterase isoform X2 [Galleria mellonella]|uniref:Probable tyrosyl-DNA phosphodiesterase isoform X2 n=1 Tax=Galleria mellonella TaxID=7137 RepID=A0ABM3MT73_GALME|nr:probable tyrosyl-DNA phosphodiesterase isoform X2 [Galleria mellonella]
MSKRISPMSDERPKRVKKECNYGEKCFRMNPVHFREFSHRHLESILDAYSGCGEYPIPEHLSSQRHMIKEQLEVIVEKKLYEPVTEGSGGASTSKDDLQSKTETQSTRITSKESSSKQLTSGMRGNENISRAKDDGKLSKGDEKNLKVKSRENSGSPTVNMEGKSANQKGTDYRPVVQPTRRPENFLKVVLPRGNMAAKHAASAPYHIFYTTISDAKETHNQPYSITFLEILDHSLGELKCSLQINFMVELGWLLAQYYFAGYSEKRLTILYGEDAPELKNINKKKPHVDAHHVNMATPFGKHHTKMMILCYEDGSLRVVVSTANLYLDDWENRTQGLWFSPRCPELPADAMPFDGESPTSFKKCLLRYLNHYQMPQLAHYVERVKRCDFSHINVFLVASAPGSHFDMDWGMTRVGALLRQHCCIPPAENSKWPLLAQASSIGSYGNDPKLWLTGDFLHHFTKIKNQPQMLSAPAELKIIYPSLENVQRSLDGLLGGGCLPYAAAAHAKQPWLNSFLYQWRATCSGRDRAMPHIKSYMRTSPDNKMAAYYLLTSGNVSKAAWGSINKGNSALRIMSYEAGVLLLPRFVMNEDLFPLSDGAKNRLIVPYDIPPTKYASDMSPWLFDYLS